MKQRITQHSMNGGIFGPVVAEREDTEAYYACVRDMLNMVPLPEGGAELRPGLAWHTPARRKRIEIDLSGATITAGAGVTIGVGGGGAATPPIDPPFYPIIGPFFGVYA